MGVSNPHIGTMAWQVGCKGSKEGHWKSAYLLFWTIRLSHPKGLSIPLPHTMCLLGTFTEAELAWLPALWLLPTAAAPTFPAHHLAFPAKTLLCQPVFWALGSGAAAWVSIILQPLLNPLTLLSKSCWAPKASPHHLRHLFPFPTY